MMIKLRWLSRGKRKLDSNSETRLQEEMPGETVALGVRPPQQSTGTSIFNRLAELTQVVGTYLRAQFERVPFRQFRWP